MKTIIISIIAVFLVSDNQELTGRWESISKTGAVSGVIFRADKTFEGYVNRKTFVSGVYSFDKGVFTMTDNGCVGVTGYYKIDFFSNGDSMRLHLVSDSCLPRGKGIDQRVYGRVKAMEK